MRSVLLLLLLLVLGIVPVHVQTENPPIPDSPPDGMYVLDELDWLTNEQENSINAIGRGLDKDEVAEMAVVTLNDCGSDKQAYRKSLFDSWGIGHSDDNDGLLILVCWYDGDSSRRSVEQLYGRGLNGVLSSSMTNQIAQESFIPAFDRGNPGNGLVAMVRSYNVFLRTSSKSSNFFVLSDWMQGVLLVLAGLGVISLVKKFFPGWLTSQEDRFRDHHHDRDGSSGFGGGSSDGGGGSSTRF